MSFLSSTAESPAMLMLLLPSTPLLNEAWNISQRHKGMQHMANKMPTADCPPTASPKMSYRKKAQVHTAININEKNEACIPPTKSVISPNTTFILVRRAADLLFVAMDKNLPTEY